MDIFRIDELIKVTSASERNYLEFLRSEHLSIGIYQLSVGQIDGQSPHSEDEIYFIRSGKGRIRVGGESQAVEAGSIIYVPAMLSHKFTDISEDLNILVFFAPPES